MNGLICQESFTSFKVSAETKVEDTKLLVTENEESQYRDETYDKPCLEYRKVSIPMQKAKSTELPSRLFSN